MHKQLILGKRMIITMLCICLTFMGAVPTFAADKMIICKCRKLKASNH